MCRESVNTCTRVTLSCALALAIKRGCATAVALTGAEPTFGKPTALFADEYDFGQAISIPNYDVTRDGRFIMLRRGAHGSSLRVVVHWAEELKQILAAGSVR